MLRPAVLTAAVLIALGGIALGGTSTEARAHNVKPTRSEIQGGLLGKLEHAKRNLQHGRTGMKWCIRHARRLLASDVRAGTDCYWPHYRLAKRSLKTVRKIRAKLIDPICGKVPKSVCDIFVYGIHPCEGHWNSYPGGPGGLNSGGPFYGGLQMDMDFQQTWGMGFYRRWGTANNWPIWAQVTAAYRGYLSRGFQPWPVCGAPYR